LMAARSGAGAEGVTGVCTAVGTTGAPGIRVACCTALDAPGSRHALDPPSAFLARASGVSSDVLSDVLRAVRLTGAVYFLVDATAPWAAEAPAGKQLAPRIMPGAGHLIEYHLVTQGRCWGGIVGEPAIRLEAGDAIVFPQGDPHVISSAAGARGRPGDDLYRQPLGTQLPVVLREKGGGEQTQL